MVKSLARRIAEEFNSLRSKFGIADGIATLDSNGKLKAAQLPSNADDVLEFANLANFPIVGEVSKLYIAANTNKLYRWTGTVYQYITSGSVDSVAGKTGNVTLVKADVGLSNVDNTSDINKPISSATQNALNLKANLASPTFTGTVSGITKAMVGLNLADNTADSAKPVSTATQNALNLKANLTSPTFTGTVSGVTATMVGLGSVNNTADAAKPVSTFQQTALNLKANLASPTFTGTVTAPSYIGTLNGNATTATTATTANNSLKLNGLTNSATGAANTITQYDASGDVNARMFRSTYANQTTISGGIAFRTNNTTDNYIRYCSDAAAIRAFIGLNAINNTADSAKPVSTAQQTAINLKANLASPALTGVPTAPTAAVATNNTQIATTAFVKSVVNASSATGFTQSLATNGWTKLPNGLIMQWGYLAGSGAVTITFPIAFPNACRNAHRTAYGTTGNAYEESIDGFTKTTLSYSIQSPRFAGAYWFAIGH